MFLQHIDSTVGFSFEKRKRKIIILISIGLILSLFISALGIHFLGTEPYSIIKDPVSSITDAANKTENNSITSNENESAPSPSQQYEEIDLGNESTETIINPPSQNKSDIEDELIDQEPIVPSSNGSSGSSNSGDSGSSDSSSGSGESESNDDDSTTDDQNESDQNCLVLLPPHPVIATISYNYTDAYFITEIAGIYDSYDIENGTYFGWCIDYDHKVNTSKKNVTLYSSYCPPDSYQIPMANWSAVNYILNNKPENATYSDIQTAIWYYINIGSSSVDPTDAAWIIITNVTLNNGTSFVPGEDDIIAIIVEAMDNPDEDQLIIIEGTMPGRPSISVEKTANVTIARIGDTINYVYLVENNGSEPLTDIHLIDNILGIITLNATSLAENEWAIGSASYSINMTDLPGPVTNIATVTATSLTGRTVSDTDIEEVLIDYKVNITINKTADRLYAVVGDLITYSYYITNTGEVSVYNISIDDDLLGMILSPITTLEPGESILVNTTYVVVDSDLPGPIINTVIVTGHDLFGIYVNNSDSYLIVLEYNASLNVTKTVNVTSAHVGDSVLYYYHVENTGSTVLTHLSLVDDKLGQIPIDNTTLLPGENISVFSTYVINCSNVLDQSLVNTVNASAITILNETIYDQSSSTVEIIYEPGISITKSLFDSFDMIWKKSIRVIEGTCILCNITIENIGSELLHNIMVSDTFPTQLVYTGQASINPIKNTPGYLEWIISDLMVNETITITYELQVILPGTFENNVSVNVQTCGESLESYDTTMITSMVCPPEVWVKDIWQNQSMVSEYNPTLIYNYNAFQSIQDAINIICDCGTVNVLSGIYGQQLFINKNVKLLGENALTTYIHPGTSPKSIIIPERSSSFTPVVMAYGGIRSSNNIITGNGTISFSMNGFSIIGGTSSQKTAIALRNVQRGCIDNEVVNTSINSFYSGIEIWHSEDVLIDHNKIENSNTALVIGSQSDLIYVSHNWFLDNSIGVYVKNNSMEHPTTINISYNYIDTLCSNDIGVWNEINEFIVNAMDNWWGEADGPKSPNGQPVYDAITGRIADSVNGEIIIGTLRFDPWAGLGATARISTTNTTVGNSIMFDATHSWGYTGEFGPEDWDPSNLNYLLHRIPLSIWDVKWDFGDGKQGYQPTMIHIYTSPGQYIVMLRVRSADTSLDRCDGYRPNEDGFVYGYAYYIINVV